MARKITGGSNVKAEPWCEGKVVAGTFEGAEVLPKCDSRKLTFRNQAGQVAVWETAALARQVQQMTPGRDYFVRCLGKTLKTANGAAWEFEVEEAENGSEAAAFYDIYSRYVAGGGK